MIVSPGSRCSMSSCDLGLGRVAGRDHDPDGPRLLELADELRDRERRRSRPRRRSPWSSPASGCRRRPRGRRVSRRRTMLAPIRPSPTNPIRIRLALPVWSCALTARRRAGAWSAAVSRAGVRRLRVEGRLEGRPGRVSGSARWTRRIGRSWASIASKSPWAWASMSWPKVYGQPGIGRSTGWSDVSWRNQPIGAPPLWSWPVEWRKRGP